MSFGIVISGIVATGDGGGLITTFTTSAWIRISFSSPKVEKNALSFDRFNGWNYLDSVIPELGWEYYWVDWVRDLVRARFSSASGCPQPSYMKNWQDIKKFHATNPWSGLLEYAWNRL